MRRRPAALAALLLGSVVLVLAGGASPEGRPLPPVGTTSTTSAPSPRWRTVWEDDFDGPAVSSDRWRVEHSTFGDGNRELQCYTPDNVSVADGRLVLEARRAPTTCPNGSTRAYSSGMVRSSAAWAYGAFEVRARVPVGAGFLPAVWLLPTFYPYGRQGRSGELDVVEVNTSDPHAAIVTAHWSHEDCGWGCARYGRRVPVAAADGFHTYRLEWAPGQLLWLVDGDPVFELGDGAPARWSSGAATPAASSATYPAPFDAQNPMYLLLNLAVGGNTPGPPDSRTPFPARLEVDRVTVQRRESS